MTTIKTGDLFRYEDKSTNKFVVGIVKKIEKVENSDDIILYFL